MKSFTFISMFFLLAIAVTSLFLTTILAKDKEKVTEPLKAGKTQVFYCDLSGITKFPEVKEQSYITNIRIPETVTNADCPFSECTTLYSICIPNNVSREDFDFKDCQLFNRW